MPTLVHFDIPTDDLERAKEFYSGIFEWKFEKPEGMDDYYLIETTDLEGNPGVGGGMGLRGDAGERITSFIGVTSIEEYAAKVEKAGGTVANRMPVPGWGYLAICFDTEGNLFGLWEENEDAE
ncbi:VOC family protein [Methanolobus sp. ZRKC3]|uniref:VOC family protein n=1 Tax=Methanolobus sp. ZRKC3 TaxID=3125786 RepID=UPI003255F5DE